MKLTTVSALALVLSLGAVPDVTHAASDALPGKVGVEGHASNPARTSTSTSGSGGDVQKYGEGRDVLPGNVGVEGHAANPAMTAESSAEPGMSPAARANEKMEVLPGNVGVEGHAQTTKQTR